MKLSYGTNSKGVTLAEVMVALGVLALATVIMTQAMLVLNRNSAMARTRNLAKAMVIGRIQEVNALPYAPKADPQVVPTPLGLQDKTETVNLGDGSTAIGSLPATLRWTVTNTDSTTLIRAVRCRVDYDFLGKKQNYEMLTFRSPD